MIAFARKESSTGRAILDRRSSVSGGQSSAGLTDAPQRASLLSEWQDNLNHSPKAATNTASQSVAASLSPSQFVHDSPGAVAQKKLNESLNQSPRIASQLRLQQMFNRSPRIVAQAQMAHTLSMRAARQSGPVLQAAWKATDKEKVSVWEEEIDGVTWYADEEGLMWYVITNPEQIKEGTLEAYRKWAGPQHKHSHEEWDEIERQARLDIPEPTPLLEENFREAESFLETVDLPPFVKKTIAQICKVKNVGAMFAMGLADTWKEEFHKLEERVAKLAEQRSSIKEKQELKGKAPFVGSADITTELNKEDVSVIRQIARSLAHAFSPATSVYVALGNSPIPIVIQLQQEHKAEVVLMPLGGLSAPPFDSPKAFEERVMTDRQRMARLMNYLDHFLAPYRVGQRTIVIVDYASSGTSMVIAQKLLSLYFKNPKRVKTFVYASEASVRDEAHEENYAELAKTGVIETAGNDPTFNKYIQKNEEKLFKNVMSLTLYESVDAQRVIATDDYTELIRPTLAGYLRLVRMFNPKLVSNEDLY
jgi:hypothetical protein